MGNAARRNLRSVDSGADEDLRALMILRDTIANCPSRLAFERWLLGFPAETRTKVRRYVQSAAPWTIEHRRAARLAAQRVREDIRQRARSIAGVA